MRRLATFPSTQWFDAVRMEFNSHEEFHQRGSGHCNCLAGVKVSDRVFVLTFEGLECTKAEETSDRKLQDVDFYMSMDIEDWREMLDNIHENGHAVGEYTLNTLDLSRMDGLSTSLHGDQYREDMFFRFNQTLQFFFDASSRVDTKY